MKTTDRRIRIQSSRKQNRKTHRCGTRLTALGLILWRIVAKTTRNEIVFHSCKYLLWRIVPFARFIGDREEKSVKR